MIPNCTLVTSCFILKKYNQHSTNIDVFIKGLEMLLKIPCYLVIFCDSLSIDKIKEIRNKYNLDNITHYIKKEIEELDYYSYIDMIRTNRENYHPTKDERTSPESHFICCSKFNFVLKAMDIDPFGTKKFGWIDSNVGDNFSKICRNYKNNMLLNVLHNCSDKFNLQILNVTDDRYKEFENKREYYSQYRWVVCGCLFITTKEIGVTILTRLNEIFLKTTEQGYGHGEEMFYLEILDEYYDDIHRSYGDYHNILNNFVKQTEGFDYVFNYISNNYLSKGHHKECIDCCEKMLLPIENFEVELNYDIYFKILFAYHIALYYYDKNRSTEIIKKIKILIDTNPFIKNEYNKNIDFYRCNGIN